MRHACRPCPAARGTCDFAAAALDDELLPRLAVVREVRRHPQLELLAQCATLAALEALPETPDVLFLDIELGEQENGLAYFKSLARPPLAVFITSHAEFALDSIEAEAFDYILKPLTAARFERVAARLLEHQALCYKAAQYELHIGAEFLNIREGYEVSRVPMQDILYLEALDNYTKIHTPKWRYLTLTNLKTLCEQLPARRFLRIHRTFAVGTGHVRSGSGAELLVEGTALPVGRTYRPQVLALLQQAC